MRAQTALYAPQPDGSTLAEFGASIQEQTGSWPEDIPEPPDIPPALEHLWAWFWQLRTANPSAGFGPAPLSFGEMDAWQRVTGNRLEPWHVDTLLAMDAALGYTAQTPALPPYLHLLGARKEALPLLGETALPLSHSLARLARENETCAQMAAAQSRASDLGALCRAKPEPMGGIYRQKIIFLTN